MKLEVRIGKCLSDTIAFRSGLKQGDILFPLFLKPALAYVIRITEE